MGDGLNQRYSKPTRDGSCAHRPQRGAMPFLALLLGLGLSFLLLGILELALRLAGFGFDPYTHYRATWGQFIEAGNDSDYVPDAQLFWRLKPARVIESFFAPKANINRYGFRGGDSQVSKPIDCSRIVALGDSGTFGWEVSDSQAYPQQLREILSSKYQSRKFDVINAGVPGYTSLQGLRLMRSHVMAFRPDVVLICFGGNDGDLLPVADKDRHLRAWVLSLQSGLLRSRVYQLLYKLLIADRFVSRASSHYNWVPRVALEDFETNIHEMIRLAQRNGVGVVLMVRRGGPNESAYAYVLEKISRQANLPFDKEGIIGHPSAEGYRRVALRVADLINRSRLLD